MKRSVLILVIISLLLSMASCGGSGKACTEHVDSDNDGKCDKCSAVLEPDNGDEGDEGDGDGGALNGDKLNIAHTDVVMLYNYSNNNEKVLAEEFIASLKEATGVELTLKPNKDEKAAYKIQFGRMRSDAVESNEVFNEIKGFAGNESSAFAITLKENVLVVTGTDNVALSAAANKLLSYVNGNKLEISTDHNESYILYSDGGTPTILSTSDYDKTVAVTSITIGGEPVYGFSNSVTDYKFYYSGNIPQQTDIDVNTLNPDIKPEFKLSVLGEGGIKITVKSIDGSVKKTFTINYSQLDLTKFGTSIVNKNGAQGVVTFVFDDGDPQTADRLNTNLLPKYQGISVTHGLITNRLMHVTGDGDYTALDPNRMTNYTYRSDIEGSKYKDTTFRYNYQFWQDILKTAEQELAGRVEVTSHSHTHSAGGEGYTSDIPLGVVGNYELEVNGSQEILREYLGADAVTYIRPGISGLKNYPANSDADYKEFLETGGTYIGARTNMTMQKAYQVNMPDDFKNTKNRFLVASLTATYHSTATDPASGYDFTTSPTSTKEECLAAGISHWTNYIDEAVRLGGWAPYCFHSVRDEKTFTHPENGASQYLSYESQVDALFAYTQALVDEGKVWCATFSDAMMYYNSWSSASVSTSATPDGKVAVKITDREPDEIYDVALTVKVTIPSSWTNVSFSYAGESGTLEIKTDENGERFVYVNTVPDTEGFIIWNS